MSLCPNCGKQVQDEAKFCAACGYDISENKKETVSKRTCAACGAPLEEGVKFCAVCGCASDQKVLEEKTQEQVKVQKAKKKSKEEKPQREKGKRAVAALGILRKVLPAIVALVIIASAVASFIMLGNRFSPVSKSREEKNETIRVGDIELTLGYVGSALAEGLQTPLRVTVNNVSGNMISDLSLDLELPYGLDYAGFKPELEITTLTAGASRTFALQVRSVSAVEAHFKTVLLVLVATAVISAGVIYLYALVCGKSLKALTRMVAAVLVVAVLMPSFALSAKASSDDGELVYNEQGDATAIKTRTSESGDFKIGKGNDGKLKVKVSYDALEKIELDAQLEDGKLRLSWNRLNGTANYRIYEAYEINEFNECAATEECEYIMDAPTMGRVCYFKIAADTGVGELWSEPARIIVGEDSAFVDSDCDMIPNIFEKVFGTSTSLDDSDGDGLSDYYELTVSFTDPTMYDSNDNGISDADEDNDGDGLSNLEEYMYGTDPNLFDSDGDGLSDGFEINGFLSNPLLYDTDGDGLSDGSEYKFGTDPTQADSDGDGVRDIDAPQKKQEGTESGAILDVSDSGGKLTAAELKDMSETATISQLDYVISPIVRVDIAETTQGVVTLPLNEQVSAAEDVVIAVYNSEDNDFRIIEDTELSEDGLSVSAPVTQEYYTNVQKTNDAGDNVEARRSYYCAFYVANWHIQFQVPLSPDREDEAHFDVEFVIDESNSMEDATKSTPNDPKRFRVEAAKSFTYGLLSGDRAAVVGFTEQARRKNNLTENMEEARAAIDSIVGNAGGTALHVGLWDAIEELLSVEDESRGRFIIALTDGEDSSSNEGAYDEIIDVCMENGIPIYTIGLGNSVNTSLLSRLAQFTGGAYFHIKSADDLPQVFNRIESTAFYGDDSDGDGLADAVEEYGLRDGMGKIYMTDPQKRFTDDDDLSDGEEAGNVMYTQLDDEGNTVSYYIMLTDPTKADTDADGIDDYDELMMGTLPWCSDTDLDGLPDGLEISIGYDPLEANADGDSYSDSEEYYNGVHWDEIYKTLEQYSTRASGDLLLGALIAMTGNLDPYCYDLSPYEKVRAVLEGALLGDFGESLAEYGVISHELSDSMYYMLGTVILDIVPVAGAIGAVRDALANMIKGDIAAAVLSLAGVIPGEGDVVNAMRKVADFLDKAYSGYTGAVEYAGKVTVNNVATAPAFVFLILRIIKLIEDNLGIDMSTQQLDELIRQQTENGVLGLTKDNMRNWEIFLNYGDGYSYYKAADAVGETEQLQLTLSNTAMPLALTQSVRALLGNKAGGKLEETAEGAVYTFTRVFDLECTAYQNSTVLENAMHDGIDRAADYADVSFGDFARKVQFVVTDSVVSHAVYNVLSNMYSYAQSKNVQLEYIIYLTSDDSDFNDNLIDTGERKHDKAIMIVPGISGSELVAGEDFTGFSIGTIKEGDMVWLPIDTYKALESLKAGDVATLPVVISDAINSLNMLQLDSSGGSYYKLKAKSVSENDESVGALGTGTAMYKGLLERYGDEYDVIFYSYDWRYSVQKAAGEMEQFINERGYESVTFVCHSMGGIVTSYYLAKSEENVEKTEKVITVGTPYGGSPKALLTLQTGKFMDVAALDYVFKTIAVNLSSVYELLPYDNVIASNGAYVTDINADPTGLLGTAQTKEIIEESFNKTLYSKALAIQEKLYASGEHIINSEDVDSYIIAGYNCPTLTRIYMDGSEPVQVGKSAAGDGTVPLISAVYSNGELFKKPIFYVNGNSEVEHSALFSDADVIQLVCAIIDKGHDVGSGDYNSAVISTQLEIEKWTGETKSEAVSDGDKTLYSVICAVYDTVIAYCPVTISLYNSVNELLGYVSSDGIFADEKYASLFELMNDGETKQVIVPENCHVEISGESEGSMDVAVVSMRQDGSMIRHTKFENISVAEGLVAAVDIAEHKNVSLSIDNDGDGIRDIFLNSDNGVVNEYETASEDSEKSETIKVYILIAFAALIILGSAAAMLIINLSYKKKRKKLSV